MSVFKNDHGPESEMKLGQCKRDYEKEIADIQTKITASWTLIEALEEYLRKYPYYDKGFKFTLPSLYGSLKLDETSLRRSVDTLQEQWEKEK